MSSQSISLDLRARAIDNVTTTAQSLIREEADPEIQERITTAFNTITRELAFPQLDEDPIFLRSTVTALACQVPGVAEAFIRAYVAIPDDGDD